MRLDHPLENPEGAKLTSAVIDLIGDHVLMYASDYPHGESHFPEAVSLVLDWEMDTERKRKLLWDNATRFYATSLAAPWLIPLFLG